MNAVPSRARGGLGGACVALAGLLSGCGGGLPLLHPAHVEPEGKVLGGVGVSGQFAVGDASRTIQQAREDSAEGAVRTSSSSESYRRGALALATMAPGLAPYVSGRVGLGKESEAGLAYSGRALRVDARHAFQSSSLALSVGLGGHALLARPDSQPAESLRGLSLGGVSGYGVDVPLLVGWRSEAGLFSAWAGVRGGYERQRGQIGLDADGSGATKMDWSANHLWGSGVVGLMAGFRHVFVALELDTTYHDASAKAGDASIALSGLTLAPAAALLGQF